jgi:pyruvate dehydrogenase E2 component (dihydrolipoamide acetyltransferase)
MSERVTMPALGESVTEGTVTRWLKAVGDEVALDEPLLEVSTDKVDTEIPSPAAGTLTEILVAEDETVPVGSDLAVIGSGADAPAGGSAGDPAGSSAQAAADDVPLQAAPSTEQAAPAQAEPEPAAAPTPEPAPAASTPEPAAAPEPATAASAQAEEPAAAPRAGTDDAGAQGGTIVTMPALGESVTEGTVTRWLKAEGDHVDVDEPLLEVSTDKVDTEIPSPVAGTVTRLIVGEDETVPVGTELAVIGGSTASSTVAAPAAAAPAPVSPPPAPQAPAAEVPAPQPPEAAPQQVPAAATADEDADSGHSAAARNEPATPPSAAPPATSPPSSSAPPSGATESPDSPDVSSYVTPLVRKLAAEHGVDLAALTGTGVGGRVRKQDVLAAAEAQQVAAAEAQKAAAAPVAAEAPAPQAAAAAPARSGALDVSAKRGTTEKMSRLRRLIAARMVESLQTSAQLTTVVEVDVTRIARLRDRAKADFAAREGVKLSFLPFFAQAAVEALKTHPTVNASIEGDEIAYHAQENLGIAVDTERGLLVPVIRDAGDLNIAGIARKISDLAERTRANKIGPDELGGGTFTLTNTGSRGALFDTPIINMPQVAILGTGAVVKRPVVVQAEDGGETLAIRSMVYLALSYDHRIVDGADAARFLVAMKDRLEEGAFEADLGL